VLAEERHFARAAERLFIAPSGLSKAISRAEEGLGVELFARSSRRVDLTPAGEALLERVHDVLGAFDAVRATAEAARAGMVGTLSIATSPVARYHVAPPILERFTEECPAVRLVRREQLAGEIVDDLLAGALDAGIAYCAPPRDGLRYEPLHDMELRVLLSSAHPLAACGRVTLWELRHEHFLIPAQMLACGSAARVEPIFRAAGFEPDYLTDTLVYDEDLHGVRSRAGIVLSARTFLGPPPPGIAVLALDPPAFLPLELVRREPQGGRAERGEEDGDGDGEGDVEREDGPSPIVRRLIEIARLVGAEQGWRVT
jgi:DNA-binding transcriptional LysR family regulator